MQRPGSVGLRWLQRPKLMAFLDPCTPEDLSIPIPILAEVAMFAYGQTGAGKPWPQHQAPVPKEKRAKTPCHLYKDLHHVRQPGPRSASRKAAQSKAPKRSQVELGLGRTQARPHGPLPSCRCLMSHEPPGKKQRSLKWRAPRYRLIKQDEDRVQFTVPPRKPCRAASLTSLIAGPVTFRPISFRLSAPRSTSTAHI